MEYICEKCNLIHNYLYSYGDYIKHCFTYDKINSENYYCDKCHRCEYTLIDPHYVSESKYCFYCYDKFITQLDYVHCPKCGKLHSKNNLEKCQKTCYYQISTNSDIQDALFEWSNDICNNIKCQRRLIKCIKCHKKSIYVCTFCELSQITGGECMYNSFMCSNCSNGDSNIMCEVCGILCSEIPECKSCNKNNFKFVCLNCSYAFDKLYCYECL